MTLSYALGKYGGTAVLRVLSRNGRLKKGIQKGSSMLHRWGDKILIFSFFVPGFRLFMPFVVGSNRLSFYWFAALTYPAGFLWVVVYFTIGSQYGKHIFQLNRYLRGFQWAMPCVCTAILIFGTLGYAIGSKNGLRTAQKHTNK